MGAGGGRCAGERRVPGASGWSAPAGTSRGLVAEGGAMTRAARPTGCRHTKPDGTRCRAAALPGRALCTFHDPGLAEERAAGRSRGGVARCQSLKGTLPPATPDLPLRTVGDVVAALGETINQ